MHIITFLFVFLNIKAFFINVFLFLFDVSLVWAFAFLIALLFNFRFLSVLLVLLIVLEFVLVFFPEQLIYILTH